jgi:hypothetical protein
VHRWTAGPPPGYELVDPAELWQNPPISTPSLRIDPTRGRLIEPGTTREGPYLVDYHYGFSSEIGAGAYERRPRAAAGTLTPVRGGAAELEKLAALVPLGTGTVQVEDSLTYTKITNVGGIHNLELRAKSMLRPLIRPLTTPTDWVFTGSDDTSKLVLDGLFVSGADIVLRGSFDSVTLSSCTLDPGKWKPDLAGGAGQWDTAADGRTLNAAHLRIEATVRLLVIERSIIGPIQDDKTHGVESLIVRDSIVQAAEPGTNALTIHSGEVNLSRSTILGRLTVHQFEASECILHDVAWVADTQHGCVRFSAWTHGSTLPRKYESVQIQPLAGLFAWREFGRPGFAQLLATASTEITQGAEDGSEMGAFAREKSGIKERSLLIKYREYLPLGLEPVVVHVT